ncbi:MAG: TAXI family TRAP transporter solute-binding subunit [Alphaproteobacteria bacterium]|nr:MAG: TAXI family TRAP transporter solute-binding subunit [Alphaproteobacteria bacterium]
MRKSFLFGILALIAGLSMAVAAEAGSPEIFRIGTGGTSGTYYPVGQAIAEAISNPGRKQDCGRYGCGVPGLLAIPQTSNGSVANIEDIHHRKVESGFSQSDVAYWATTGSGIFSKLGNYEDVAAIASLYMENIHLVARKGSGIRSIYDLVGKRVSLDDPGSGTLVDARIILNAFGIDEKDMKAQYVKPAAAMKKMRAGSLDAFFIVAGSPSKAIVALADEDLITLINIEGSVVDQIIHDNSFFSRQVIPAGSYKGIGEIKTLGVAALWVVRKDEDPKKIYAITRSFWQLLPEIAKPGSHPKLKQISLETAFDSMSVPLHPGALKYYHEIGLNIPDGPSN